MSIYDDILGHIFSKHYEAGTDTFTFERNEIVVAATELGLDVPKNLGDVVYSYRYRGTKLPDEVENAAPEGKEWIILGEAKGVYRFRLVLRTRIEPQPNLYQIKVPDSTPEIVARYALGDEQALLAKVRYNRLIDLFMGITTYSLQNHLNTAVGGVQVEVDELYVGVGTTGAQYIIPVQAKGGSDRLGRVQLEQDLLVCQDKYPDLICRPVGAQFMDEEVIALFELAVVEDDVKILDERHYRLVPYSEITETDLQTMRQMLPS